MSGIWVGGVPTRGKRPGLPNAARRFQKNKTEICVFLIVGGHVNLKRHFFCKTSLSPTYVHQHTPHHTTQHATHTTHTPCTRHTPHTHDLQQDQAHFIQSGARSAWVHITICLMRTCHRTGKLPRPMHSGLCCGALPLRCVAGCCCCCRCLLDAGCLLVRMRAVLVFMGWCMCVGVCFCSWVCGVCGRSVHGILDGVMGATVVLSGVS